MSARNLTGRWLSSLATIALNAVLGAIGLIIFARTLGPGEYGVLVATGTVGLLASEFVGLGTGDIMIRQVSRDPAAHRVAFGRALKMIALTIVPIVLLASILVLHWFELPVSYLMIATLVGSEVLTTRIVFLTEQSAIAHQATGAANANRVFATLARLVAICLAIFVAGVSSAAEWTIFAVGLAIVSVGGTLAMTIRRFGSPDLGAPVGTDLHLGGQFSLMQIVRAVQFSADKFAVGWLGSAATIGTYGIASRFAQLGMLPAIAVTRITYPRFFAEGAKGLPGALHFAWRILPAIVGIGAVASAGVASLVLFLPWLFGPQYEQAGPFILILACLPLVAGLQNLAGDVLSGSDRQSQRLMGGVIGLVLLVIAVITGAQIGGVMGAAWGYMAGQLIFTAVSWGAVLLVRSRA